MSSAQYTYIKYNRSELAKSLLSKPIANHVLAVIAQRARYTDDPITGLKKSQCFMGDHLTIGISRQQYRTAISNLQKWGFVTIKATTKGTVVTLTASDIYDINNNNQPSNQPSSNHHLPQNATKNQPSNPQKPTINKCSNSPIGSDLQGINKNKQPSNNHQTNHQATIKQPSNQPLTKNDKKVINKERSFATFWNLYPKKVDKQKASKSWGKLSDQEHQAIIIDIPKRLIDPSWSDPKYIPHPTTFLNGRRWEDELPAQSSKTTKHESEVML